MVRWVIEKVLTVDCREVLLGDAVVFPGLSDVAGLSRKGVDQEVSAVATSIVEYREHLPIPVYLDRREHMIDL